MSFSNLFKLVVINIQYYFLVKETNKSEKKQISQHETSYLCFR